VTRHCARDAEAREAQETVLAWLPVEFCGYGDADEVVGGEGEGCALDAAVFEKGAEVGVDVAWDVYGGCCDEVVPKRCMYRVSVCLIYISYSRYLR